MQQQTGTFKSTAGGRCISPRSHATTVSAIGDSECPMHAVQFLSPDLAQPRLGRLRAASGEAPSHAPHYAARQQLPVARHRAVAAGVCG